jgi:hypothetical protein
MADIISPSGSPTDIISPSASPTDSIFVSPDLIDNISPYPTFDEASLLSSASVETESLPSVATEDDTDESNDEEEYTSASESSAPSIPNDIGFLADYKFGSSLLHRLNKRLLEKYTTSSKTKDVDDDAMVTVDEMKEVLPDGTSADSSSPYLGTLIENLNKDDLRLLYKPILGESMEDVDGQVESREESIESSRDGEGSSNRTPPSREEGGTLLSSAVSPDGMALPSILEESITGSGTSEDDTNITTSKCGLFGVHTQKSIGSKKMQRFMRFSFRNKKADELVASGSVVKAAASPAPRVGNPSHSQRAPEVASSSSSRNSSPISVDEFIGVKDDSPRDTEIQETWLSGKLKQDTTQDADELGDSISVKTSKTYKVNESIGYTEDHEIEIERASSIVRDLKKAIVGASAVVKKVQEEAVGMKEGQQQCGRKSEPTKGTTVAAATTKKTKSTKQNDVKTKQTRPSEKDIGAKSKDVESAEPTKKEYIPLAERRRLRTKRKVPKSTPAKSPKSTEGDVPSPTEAIFDTKKLSSSKKSTVVAPSLSINDATTTDESDLETSNSLENSTIERQRRKLRGWDEEDCDTSGDESVNGPLFFCGAGGGARRGGTTDWFTVVEKSMNQLIDYIDHTPEESRAQQQVYSNTFPVEEDDDFVVSDKNKTNRKSRRQSKGSSANKLSLASESKHSKSVKSVAARPKNATQSKLPPKKSTNAKSPRKPASSTLRSKRSVKSSKSSSKTRKMKQSDDTNPTTRTSKKRQQKSASRVIVS